MKKQIYLLLTSETKLNLYMNTFTYTELTLKQCILIQPICSLRPLSVLLRPCALPITKYFYLSPCSMHRKVEGRLYNKDEQ